MTAHPVLLGILGFGLGIVLQAILMLRSSLRSGDAKRTGLALLFSLGGWIPGRHEGHYYLLFHVFMSFVVFAVAFTYLFRERLLTRIGGRLLLAWNLLLIYVAMRAGWTSRVQILLLAIPTALTVLNAFSDIDRAFGWKVFFHAWFSTILVVIAIDGFDAGWLSMFFTEGGPVAARPALEMVVAGGAFLYIVTNAWFVLALAPVPVKRYQPWRERMEQIRRHMELLAQGYVWEKDEPLRSLAVLVVLPLVLLAIARWGAGNDRAIVPLAIALMPLLAGQVAVADEPLEVVPAGPPAARRRNKRDRLAS